MYKKCLWVKRVGLKKGGLIKLPGELFPKLHLFFFQKSQSDTQKNEWDGTAKHSSKVNSLVCSHTPSVGIYWQSECVCTNYGWRAASNPNALLLCLDLFRFKQVSLGLTPIPYKFCLDVVRECFLFILTGTVFTNDNASYSVCRFSPKCSVTKPWRCTYLRFSRWFRRASGCGAPTPTPSTSTGTARQKYQCNHWRTGNGLSLMDVFLSFKDVFLPSLEHFWMPCSRIHTFLVKAVSHMKVGHN